MNENAVDSDRIKSVVLSKYVVYCCRSSKQDRSGDLQCVSSVSAKYDVGPRGAGDVITWKQHHQQQQMYNRQLMMRQYPAGAAEAFLADRDYATTLQMRRSAAGHPSSSPLLHHPQPPPVDAFDPAVLAACSCPLHGHLAAAEEDLPPPPSPLPQTSAASPRFSSFRPRVEHIYEVPKWADGAVGGGDPDDEDDAAAAGVNCASPLYSELDTTAFGTVGRRTPSRRGSARRQPNSSLH